MKFESPEHIEQSPEELPQLSVGKMVEGVVFSKGPDSEYVGTDAEGHVFIIPKGGGWQEGDEIISGNVEVTDTAEDEQGNIRYIARYIPE